MKIGHFSNLCCSKLNFPKPVYKKVWVMGQIDMLRQFYPLLICRVNSTCDIAYRIFPYEGGEEKKFLNKIVKGQEKQK